MARDLRDSVEQQAFTRLEGQIAIGGLLQRFPGMRLASPPKELDWRAGAEPLPASGLVAPLTPMGAYLRR